MVALLFRQLNRCAEVLRRVDVEARNKCILTEEIRTDFNRHLILDGAVAGYAIFEACDDQLEVLLYHRDIRIDLKFSLLTMTRSIVDGLFTQKQARHHLKIICEHLLFLDGVRLVEKPVVYRSGSERFFRRAEPTSSFGREIDLMYVHAHLRYVEAMTVLDEANALCGALKVRLIVVTEHLINASLRRRNAYFSNSDAAFLDR